MSARCKQGHASSELDYCSVCGAPMGPERAASAAAGGHAPCPACAERRVDPAARFCEVCRFDFVAKAPGPPPVARESRPAPARIPSVSPPHVKRTWSLVLTVDPTLDVDPDPKAPCPIGTAPQVFAVADFDMLVGRHDEKRDIHPELSVRDPGASRRHAKFVTLEDGALALQDLASMNGTKINGADVVPGSRRTLVDGDEVTLGRWTRIRVRGQR
jgi:hypothetical protein